jgi:hypothetical protein
LGKDTEITKLRTSKGKEIVKLNIIINKMKDRVVSLLDNVQCLKEDMECVHFDNEMRKDFNSVLGSKQNTIKKKHETMIDQREMACEMLDEVNNAKQKARVMTKKAEHVTNVSTARQKKIISKTQVISKLQDQQANFSKAYERYIEEHECCLVESDMEKMEKIAELENDCNEAIEELHVSISFSHILLLQFHITEIIHLT